MFITVQGVEKETLIYNLIRHVHNDRLNVFICNMKYL